MTESDEKETDGNGEMRPTRWARIDDQRLSDRTERYGKEGVAYFAWQRLGETGSGQLAETMQLIDRRYCFCYQVQSTQQKGTRRCQGKGGGSVDQIEVMASLPNEIFNNPIKH